MEYEHLTWKAFDDAIKYIADECKTIKGLKSVYGIPRGGLIPAVALSHYLELPLVDKPNHNSLIVDDIADSGKTMKDYGDNWTATIYYYDKSVFEPDFWMYAKKKEWVVFPWERLKQNQLKT